MKLIKKYLLDVLILGGVFYFLLEKYSYSVRHISMSEKFTTLYHWEKIIPIILVLIGIDIVIRRLIKSKAKK